MLVLFLCSCTQSPPELPPRQLEEKRIIRLVQYNDLTGYISKATEVTQEAVLFTSQAPLVEKLPCFEQQLPATKMAFLSEEKDLQQSREYLQQIMKESEASITIQQLGCP